MPISVPSFGLELFFSAIREGNLDEVIHLFRKSYSNKYYKGMTPLRYACCMNNPKVVQYLLDQGCDIEDECVIQNFKERPIHTAVYFKNVSVVLELIKRGCKLNVRNFEGQTPLDMAKHFNSEKCVEVIMEAIENSKNIENKETTVRVAVPSTSQESASITTIKSPFSKNKDTPGCSSYGDTIEEFDFLELYRKSRPFKRLWLGSFLDPCPKKCAKPMSEWRALATPSKALIKERNNRRWGKTDHESIFPPLSDNPLVDDDESSTDMLDLDEERRDAVLSMQCLCASSDEDEEAVAAVLPEMISSVCQVCRGGTRNSVFNCGHAFCTECSERATTCYRCEAVVKSRRKLYL